MISTWGASADAPPPPPPPEGGGGIGGAVELRFGGAPPVGPPLPLPARPADGLRVRSGH